jgi:IS30 family transposase
MSYQHLTIEERACIAFYYKENKSITEIAYLLKRNKSTISREISRNLSKTKGYSPIVAQQKYKHRRKNCVRKIILKSNEELFDKVCTGLNNYWSPEQIVNTLPKEMQICYSTIYRAIKTKIIPKEFCVKLRRYGKILRRNKSKGKAFDFSLVRTFSQRPTTVDNRSKYGHWELDTLVLRPECECHLATFVERKSRLLIIRKIPDKKAKTMGDVIINVFSSVPSKFRKTFTVDRGLEFTDWRRVEKELKVKVYFCDPYSPHQRGTNENTNGLIRQFFPRRTILPEVTDEVVAQVETLINNRPRKCLQWQSPYQNLCCT